MSCPQTEAEIKAYFWELIGKSEEGSANDFKAVMAKPYPWNEQMLQIPSNLPGPGQQLPADAPFYGITQQTSGGVSSGRIWVPAAVPQVDENGNKWYTRYIQIIKDKPGGIHRTDFLWTWWYQSGHDYVPICKDTPGPDPTPPTELEARVKALEVKYAFLEERVTVLETSRLIPKKIAMRNLANGKIVCAEIRGDGSLKANRDKIGPWEEFVIIILDQ